MVRQYYVDEITDISEQELRPLFQTVEPPACLLGGWAVHLHVNDGFQAECGRDYIGSRDVDLGFHVDPGWAPGEVDAAPVGQSVKRVVDVGYIPLSFRFVRHFNRYTGETLTAEEAKSLPSHHVFDLYLDLIPDTQDLDTFHEVFGFRPPAEPLLAHVFTDDAAQPLTTFRSWDVPEEFGVVDADLLAAMKIRWIPDRDMDQKRVKDVADLHALLWYVREYREIRSDVLSWVSERDIEQLREHVGADLYADAANLLQVDEQLVEDSVEQLIL
ncbi:hypothetical protein BRC85_09385 [Halobacteriales archaeon QS_1_69_70]|nr:MAG: hypothetical protein BRC85_09385 [Halobacteriales archaeon QS_1_69_70]